MRAEIHVPIPGPLGEGGASSHPAAAAAAAAAANNSSAAVLAACGSRPASAAHTCRRTRFIHALLVNVASVEAPPPNGPPVSPCWGGHGRYRRQGEKIHYCA